MNRAHTGLSPKWFVKGDIDGFFGLALDNLIQVLLIMSLCRGLLGFPDRLILGYILPGVAVSLLIGNVAYAWMAFKQGQRDGRDDYCALPFGINTPSVFVYIFLVMLPVKLRAQSLGLTNDAASTLAWQAGLAACLGSAVIEVFGSFIAGFIRKLAPRAALLSTLSGIALGFISLPFVYRTFAEPIVGFSTLAIILITYFGGLKYRWGLPGGLIAVAVGTALAWTTGLAPSQIPTNDASFHLPQLAIVDLFSSLKQGFLLDYLNIIIPVGAFNVIGSLQNLESAEAAGDKYPNKPSMLINGFCSILAGVFGSCFPTTIYIGHPGWKAMGARCGYSILSGIFMTIICVTGTASLIFWAIPIEAGMAIVLWIGIVITAQAFQATKREHAPASVIGILIGVAAFGTLMAKTGLRVADAALGNTLNWKEKSDAITQAFAANDIASKGLFAVEQGTIFTAMIFAAITVEIIERKLKKAAVWALIGAALSATGLIHSYVWEFKDTPLSLSPAWTWTIAYCVMATILFVSSWLTVPDENSALHS
ncbi:MAG: NCS2 family permease [Proteobacteria bacterium]|nr:MAG: NCS2 family permease [Pseudomonadota bacterium]